MIKLIRSPNDSGKCMIDLVTMGRSGQSYVWGIFHEDMLHDSNIGQPTADGVNTAYDALRSANEVECVLLTVEEFKALTREVPA